MPAAPNGPVAMAPQRASGASPWRRSGHPAPAAAPGSVQEPRDHRVDDQREKDEPRSEEEEAECPGDCLLALPFVLHAVGLQAARGDEAVVPALPFVQELGLRDPAGEDDRV